MPVSWREGEAEGGRHRHRSQPPVGVVDKRPRLRPRRPRHRHRRQLIERVVDIARRPSPARRIRLAHRH